MKRILLAALIGCAAYMANAQAIEGTTPFQLGVVDHIESGITGQSRDLNIYLPADYTPEKEWPVIYLLDGSKNEDFVHISGIVQFLTEIVDTMPEAIIVGIANVDRKHDFTFAAGSTAAYKKELPTAGGSKDFITFLEKDLKPFIRKKYHGTGTETLIGQSLGGLVAAEILLTRANMFENYLIVSPSIWWNDEALLKTKPEGLANTKYARICIAVGSEGDQMRKGAKGLMSLIQSRENADIKVSFIDMPQESHLTILHNAAYKGLQLLLPKAQVKK